MREILFRGKVDSVKWVFGSLLKNYSEDYNLYLTSICEHNTDTSQYVFKAFRSVDEETIGQYTGVKDKNGTKIFEGDILKDRITPEHGYYIVADLNKEQQLYYRDSRDGWVSKSVINFSNLITDSIKIIGNIHDNPELIKQ